MNKLIYLIVFYLVLLSIKSQAQDTLNSCNNLFGQKNYAKIVLLLDEFVKSHKQDTTAWELCGDAYYEMSLFGNAAQRYTENLLLTKGNQRIYKKRANCYYYAKEYKAARYEWEDVCRMLPDDKTNWYYLGLTYQQIEHYQDGINALTQALNIDSVFVLALQARGNLYLKTQQYYLALGDIDSSLKITQYNEQQFINRGLALIGLKRFKEAEKIYERIIQRNEKNVHAWFGLGNVYHLSRNYAKAIDAFDVCVALRPDFELAYFKRGLSKLEINQQERGCADLQEALSLGYMEALIYLKKFCGR
jgi:tetratricopeptide (TPR) repeat protein